MRLNLQHYQNVHEREIAERLVRKGATRGLSELITRLAIHEPETINDAQRERLVSISRIAVLIARGAKVEAKAAWKGHRAGCRRCRNTNHAGYSPAYQSPEVRDAVRVLCHLESESCESVRNPAADIHVRRRVTYDATRINIRDRRGPAADALQILRDAALAACGDSEAHP